MINSILGEDENGAWKKVLSLTLSIKDLFYFLKSKAFWTNRRRVSYGIWIVHAKVWYFFNLVFFFFAFC